MRNQKRLDATMALLEELHQRLGAAYLSDLRTPFYRERLISLLRALEPSNYTEAEWRECWSYLLVKSPDQSLTPEQLAEGMLAALRLEKAGGKPH